MKLRVNQSGQNPKLRRFDISKGKVKWMMLHSDKPHRSIARKSNIETFSTRQVYFSATSHCNDAKRVIKWRQTWIEPKEKKLYHITGMKIHRLPSKKVGACKNVCVWFEGGKNIIDRGAKFFQRAYLKKKTFYHVTNYRATFLNMKNFLL